VSLALVLAGALGLGGCSTLGLGSEAGGSSTTSSFGEFFRNSSSTQPLPPALPNDLIDMEPLPDTELPPVQTAEAPAAPAGDVCLRFVDGDWRAVSSSTSLSSCVQALYAGTCVRPGDALYGRFGNTTLRLVPGRVERSDDNTNFRTLVEQDRRCNLGPID
jgi:hypothetical protein